MKNPAPTLMVPSLADAARKAWGGGAVLVQY